MKKYLLLILLSLISLSVTSEIVDSTVEIKPVRVSINPPKILNFKQRQIEDSIALTKFSLKRTYRKLFHKKMYAVERKDFFESTDNKILPKSFINDTTDNLLSLTYTSTQKFYNDKSPDTILTFEAPQLGIQSNEGLPPDITIAAGPEHLMYICNNVNINTVRIFDKSGNLISVLTGNQFFSSDSTQVKYYGDPRVIYDFNRNRWVASCIGETVGTPNDRSWHILIAVSGSDDPTQNWFQYDIPFGTNPNYFKNALPDYPQIAYNKNWMVVTSNIICLKDSFICGGTPTPIPIEVFNKDSLYAGIANSYIDIILPPGTAAPLCPASDINNVSDTLYFLSRNFPAMPIISSLRGPINDPTYHIDTVFSKSLVPNNIEVTSSTAAEIKEDLGPDMIKSATFINKHIWFSTTIAIESPNNPTGWQAIAICGQYDPIEKKLLQKFYIKNDSSSISYAYPQIVVNKNGDALVVLSKIPSNYPPAISYVYRSKKDSPNTFREPFTYKWGTYRYQNGNRWGDYFGAALDPIDSSFWVAGETLKLFITPDTQYVERPITTIAHVNRVEPCTEPKSLSFDNINSTSVVLNWNSNFNDTAYLVIYSELGKSVRYIDTVYTTYDTLTNLSQLARYECTVQSFCPDGLSKPASFEFQAKPNNCIDYYEMNDAFSTAKKIDTNVDIFASIDRKGDRDYFKFVTLRGSPNINITLENLTLDYDLYLYNKNGTLLSSSTDSGTSNEEITYNSVIPETYVILIKSKVSTVFDPSTCYKLRVNTSSSPY